MVRYAGWVGQAVWGDVSGRSGGSDDVMYCGRAEKSNKSGRGLA